MVINLSVQCNGGFLLDIMLLTLSDNIGKPFYYLEELCPYSQCSYLKLLIAQKV